MCIEYRTWRLSHYVVANILHVITDDLTHLPPDKRYNVNNTTRSYCKENPEGRIRRVSPAFGIKSASVVEYTHIDGLVQDRSVLAMELLQSCAKSMICSLSIWLLIVNLSHIRTVMKNRTCYKQPG